MSLQRSSDLYFDVTSTKIPLLLSWIFAKEDFEPDQRPARRTERLAILQGWRHTRRFDDAINKCYTKRIFVVAALSSQPRVGSAVTELMSLIEI